LQFSPSFRLALSAEPMMITFLLEPLRTLAPFL